MAKIVDEQIESSVLGASYPAWKIALLGAILGVFYWALTAFISRYVIESLLCGPNGDIEACANPVVLAGNISTILVAVAGLFIMVRMRLAQPLLVVIASAISLWGLSQWTNGLFWLEAVAWSVLLYALAYSAFVWVTRHRNTAHALIIVIAIVILVRLAAIL